MKKKVTRVLVEITLNDMAERGYIDDLLDDEDINSFKIKKMDTVLIEDEEDGND